MKINNFQERLDFSEKTSHEHFWNEVYKKAFPNLLWSKICTTKCQAQFLGIDRVIQLDTGKTLYIDEKKRESVYDDILLEFISNDVTGSPGWMEKKLLIDYIAYAFMPLKHCYILDWNLLKRAWKHCKESWKNKYKIIYAQNEGYKTISVAVPIEELLKNINRAMIIELK